MRSIFLAGAVLSVAALPLVITACSKKDDPAPVPGSTAAGATATPGSTDTATPGAATVTVDGGAVVLPGGARPPTQLVLPSAWGTVSGMPTTIAIPTTLAIPSGITLPPGVTLPPGIALPPPAKH
jgi:hypothetical protein